MKRVSCLIFALLVCAYTASAQFYFKLGLGYAVPQAAQTIDGTGQPYNGSLNKTTYTDVYNIKSASFSAGMQGGLGLGYMFSDHIGIQLDANIGLSPKKYTFTIYNVIVQGVLSNVDVVEQAKTPLIVMPSLVLQTGGDPLNLYTRIGVALPLSSNITMDQIESNVPGTGATSVYDFSFQIKNSFSVGLAAAAGVKYKINDKISIWGELSMLSMSLYIKEADLQGFSYNGQSQSLSYVTSPHVTNYSKTAVVDSNGAQQPTYSQPFSNFGMNVGVTFNLSEKRRSHHTRNSDGEMDDKKPFRRR